MGKHQKRRGFIYFTERWHITRISYDQVFWDAKAQRPIKKYFVTVSNGAFTACGISKRLWVAWLRAHRDGRLIMWRLKHERK